MFSNCNDNAWRHFVWTISSDGLTWKVYINGSLHATITAANVGSYAQVGGVGPNYPSNVLRTLNYIGKSNWPDAYLKGSVDEFYFYNSAIDQTAVTNIYNSTLTYTKNNNISVIYYTGTVCAYLGSTDPDGWVICDGITRNVSDNRYANLVTMGIGTGNANSYTPPDYRGAFLRGSNKGTANATAGTTYGSRAPDLKNSQNHMTETHTHTASSGNQSSRHSHNVTFSNAGSHSHTGTLAVAGGHSHFLTTGSAGSHTHNYSDAYSLEQGGSRVGLAGTDNDNRIIYGNGETTSGQIGDHTHNTGTTSNQNANHTHNLTLDSNGSHTHTLTTDSNNANHNHSITVSNSTTNAGSETRPHNYGVNWMLKL